MLFCKVRFLSHRFVLLLSVWVCCLLIGCVEESPLKVGFIGGLTGRVVAMASSMRSMKKIIVAVSRDARSN